VIKQAASLNISRQLKTYEVSITKQKNKTKLKGTANSAGSDNPFLHRWVRYSTGRRFETADFLTEKGVREP
jgi:hypothetical protein